MRLRLLLLLLFAAIVRSTPTGGCCVGPNDCSVESETNCETTEEGRYIGDGTNCAGSPCTDFTTCCLPSGECGILTAMECSDDGGLDRGSFDNVSGFCSDQVDCMVTAGCCEPDGFTGCINAVPAACLAMERNVMGATCNDQPFCIGACCVGGACSQVTPMECSQPAEYNGNLVSCSNVCQNTPGACCFEDGSCTSRAEYGCFLDDGVYQGRNTVCANTTCPTPAVPPPPAPPVEPQDRMPYIIGISVAIGLILICGCCALFYCFRNRKPQRYARPPY